MWPGVVPAGKIDQTTVHAAMDFLPTFCAFADIRPPKGVPFDGIDVSSAYRGVSEVSDRVVYWEFGRRGKPGAHHSPPPDDRSPTVAVRAGRWKLLVNDDGTGVELYDLSESVAERENVAGFHPEIAQRLQSQGLRWFDSLPRSLATHDGSCLHSNPASSSPAHSRYVPARGQVSGENR